MCTRPVTIRVPPNPFEYSQGYRGYKVIQVPCGKCPECLGKRQTDNYYTSKLLYMHE